MGKITGFMEIERRDRPYAPVAERVRVFREFIRPLPDAEIAQQGARCMDCGIPFCQTGCPVNNIIPDWNDLVYRGHWRDALEVLHSTNNFPEFTGRVCPAPCEAACTLNINDDPVTIKSIEQAIIDKGYAEGWVAPQPPARKTGRKVAVVGSGPAGMACAQQLARAGHDVTLFEKSDRIGGLLRYGIPDFKMEKHLIDRRIEQMSAEGVTFRTGVHVGVTMMAAELLAQHDAVVLTGGEPIPEEESAAAAEGAAELETHGKVKIDHVGGHDDEMLKELIQRHLLYTGSERARRILENWAQYLPKFVKVMPLEYRRALAEMAQEKLRNEQPTPRVELRAND